MVQNAIDAEIAACDALSLQATQAGDDPFLRELLVPFGSSGYVALFEIEDATTVTILAVRHQLEDDYH